MNKLINLLYNDDSLWYNVDFAKEYGVNATILLGVLAKYYKHYSDNNKLLGDGCVPLTRDKIEAETTLTPHQQRLAFKVLQDNKLVSMSKKGGVIGTFCYKIDKDILLKFPFISSDTLNYADTIDYNPCISKGERVVKEYLDELGVLYATQFDTLKCINPKTNYQLPYDFELLDYKTIIEVQGEQHKTYIECVHKNKENFEYQLYKDRVKRDFAIAQGYKFVEIFYCDLKDGDYKTKINEAIQ